MARTADTPIDKFSENLADFADLLTQKFTAQSTGEPEVARPSAQRQLF